MFARLIFCLANELKLDKHRLLANGRGTEIRVRNQQRLQRCSLNGVNSMIPSRRL